MEEVENNMEHILINLDTESKKIYKKIPRGERSKTMRNLLKEFENKQIQEDMENPQMIIKSLSSSSENSSAAQGYTLTPEKQLKEMAAIVQQKKRARSKKPADNILKLLKKPLS